MPSVDIPAEPTLEGLTSLLPLSYPLPNPKKRKDLITAKEAHREEDLLRNPDSFRAWWTALNAMREEHGLLSKSTDLNDGIPPELVNVLGPLASPTARHTFQRLLFTYESALSHFPASFKLWKAYLNFRMSFVLGKLVVKKRAGGKKKFPEMKDALEEAEEDLEQWETPLNPVVGWEEWKLLIATFERCLMWLPKMPRIWLMYFSVFFHPNCPSVLSYTHARRTFDRALRTLPPSLHHRIWVPYLLWAERKGGEVMVSVYKRYLSIDPSITERFAGFLLSDTISKPRPLPAAKLLLSLARKAAKGEYVSPEGKSPYQILEDWIDVVERFPEEVGLGVDETDDSNAEVAKVDAEREAAEAEAAKDGQLVRKDGVGAAGTQPSSVYDEDEDPQSTRKLNVENIIHKDGLSIYKDQAGRLWTGLATYWTKRGEFDRAKSTFEEGMKTVLTVRDFSKIFDSYQEFCEAMISSFMELLEEEDDREEAAETEKDMDVWMAELEGLADRRPFLVNDVLLRRNPHDVQEWEKRVALHGEDDEAVAKTYTQALETVHPRKATANLHQLYINFAKFYEEGGASGQAEPDLESARKILEKATKVNFKTVEDLAEVWCEWSEMELRHDNYDEAIRVMQRATVIPKNTKINYHDHTLSVQARLFKSLKLWSFYVDLEESIGTVETTKAVYDKILELRIANAQIIVNYASFLEENHYFEESFKAYERGVELFTFPISFEIWNIYLTKFVKRYGGTKLERARDLFEQALEKCPPKHSKPLFLMYAQLEEDYGLAKSSIAILDRATKVVADEDKFEMFTIYIAKATANFGLQATRPIYERAIEVLPDRQTAEMCLRFAALERKLGEIDRARAVYAHASQFCDPRVYPKFWTEWNAFEIETGSEDTFREMLRIKRSVQAQFNTESSYLTAQAIAAEQGNKSEEATPQPVDAMAAAERQAKGPAFVAAKSTGPPKEDSQPSTTIAQATNADEIHISDDED